MNKELLTKLKCKTKVYERWKQYQITEGMQRTGLNVQALVQKVKAHLELNLARVGGAVRNKKKHFCRPMSSKRNTML